MLVCDRETGVGLAGDREREEHSQDGEDPSKDVFSEP